MDKKLAGLIGAVGAVVVAPSQAAPLQATIGIEDAMRAESYADLLRPIPNASALLRVSNAAAAEPVVLTVQYYEHHHHHRYYRPRYYGPVLVPPRFFPRHHHHHHHHSMVVVPGAAKPA